MDTCIIYLLLGGNEGDREGALRQALEAIGNRCGTVIRASALYETAAWGKEDQPPFLNQAAEVATRLSPEQLLQETQAIEAASGRTRVVKWAQRTLDIDLLFYGNAVIGQPGLQVPHPALQDRRFALVPLCEIAPNLMHPVLLRTVQELLDQCRDPLPVVRYEAV